MPAVVVVIVRVDGCGGVDGGGGVAGCRTGLGAAEEALGAPTEMRWEREVVEASGFVRSHGRH